MASESAHRAAAIANRQHAEWLLASRASDQVVLRWAVTATFYAALHALSAQLVAQHIIVRNHESRKFAITNPANGVSPDVYAAYRYLQRRSVGARYDLWTFTPEDVRALIDGPLSIIFDFVGL